MITNQQSLLMKRPIKNMLDHKARAHGVSHGLSEAGYDITIKQAVKFVAANSTGPGGVWVDGVYAPGRFTLASAIEEFDMPTDLIGIVHDKSTWARQGLSVLNTCIEPGWKGFLTLELCYHGHGSLIIPAGAGIAQVIFHQTVWHAAYDGKYQHQPDQPVEAKHG